MPDTLSLSTAPSPEPEPTSLPGLDIIGSGYDVFGSYANPESCTWPLFQFGPEDKTWTFGTSSYRYPGSSQLSFQSINRNQEIVLSGQSDAEYITSLNVETKLSGDYGFFSASLETDFSSRSIQQNDCSYVTVRWSDRLWRMTLPSPQALQPLLTDSFRADLEGPQALAPNDLFTKYGTHYVSSVIMGGRADCNSTLATSTFSSTQTLSVAAEMSYDTIRGSISVQNKTTYQTQIDTFNQAATSSVTTQGGVTADGGELILQGPAEFQAWLETVADQPGLAAFDSTSLTEIWQLCADGDRQAELAAAYPMFMQYRLAFKMTSKLMAAGSDAGSGAHDNVAFFRPAPLTDGWCWVGQYAQPSYGPPDSGAQLLLIKPSRPGAVVAPVSYRQIWNDHGSDRQNDYSMWAPVPPTDDYVALGHVCRFDVGDYNQPSGTEVDGLVCVHKSLVGTAGVGPQIWNDAGSRANADGSIWPLVPTDPGSEMTANTFYTVQSHASPATPLNDAFCLLTERCDPASD